MGRGFSEADQAPGAIETVILMDGYWGRRFGRDPAIIGREVAIDSRPRVVVGVMPASFRFLDETPDLVLPVRIDPATLTLGGFNYEGLARLAPGVTVEQASADIARMLPVWLDEWPSCPGVDRSAFSQMTPLVRPLKQELVGSVGNMLWVLMGTIGIVLVIACANVANLVLVRAQDRQHELALRTALGAGRGRLARQLLVENLVLGLLGGTLGLLLAFAGLRVLSTIGAGQHSPPARDYARSDGAGLYAGALAVVGAPFREHSRGEGRQQAPRPDASGRRARFERQSGAQPRAKRPGRGSGRARTHSARGVGADGSDVSRVTSCATWLHRPDHVQLVRVTISEGQIADPERVLRLQREMLERLATIPGVTDASFTGNVPMAGERSRSSIYREDVPMSDQARHRFAGSDSSRRATSRPSAPASSRAATSRGSTSRAAGPSPSSPRTWRASYGASHKPRSARGFVKVTRSPWREVVGVVADVYDDGVHRQAPSIVYWPSFMETFLGQPFNVRRAVTFAMRSSRAGSEGLLDQVRDAISSVNADVPLTRVRTLGDVYGRSMAATSFALVMLVIAAAMALLLGIVGIYGVIAYAVTQRRREIGIRAALGASRHELAAMFVRHGVMLALAGVACGLAGAATLTRLMASLLFGTSPFDPIIYVLVSVGLASIAALATYVPARRAALVDPVQTLRGE